MQSVIKLMPEPIPEVPRDAHSDPRTSNNDGYGAHDSRPSGFSQEFDQQMNQYNDRNPQGGSNQQAHADIPASNSGDSGNGQLDERQQSSTSNAAPMTAEELRALAKQSQQDDTQAAQKPLIDVQADPKDGKADIKPLVAQASKDALALDSLVAMVEDAEKLIRTDKPSANIDSEFLKQNKLTDAMDQALIGKSGDKRSVVDVLKGFTQAGSDATNAATAEAQKAQDPQLAKLLEQVQGKTKQGSGDEKSIASDKLAQGKAGQANLVIPGEGDSYQDVKSSDLLKMLKGQSPSEILSQVAGQAPKQSLEQLVKAGNDAEAQGEGDGDISITDMLAAQGAKGKKSDGDSTDGQTKPMELADKDKPSKPVELSDKVKPIKPMELAQGGNTGKGADEQSIAGDEAFAKQQGQSSQVGEAQVELARQVKGDNKSVVGAGQTIDTINVQTHDKAAEHVNQQLAAQVNQASNATQSATKSAQQSAAQAIVTGDKRQSILGKAANTKGASESTGQVNSEKLAQMSSEELQKQSSEQQFAEGHSGDEGVFDDMMHSTMAKDAPVANTKVASQFGQTLNQFSTDSATRLNATTQTLSATGTEKTPPQVTETLQMTRPDLSVNMKERMTLMMKNGIQTADIRLDPAELGQMQVKMSVENDVTSVSFVVQNSQAKELLEKALPQLKEMLAEQGVEMGESSVSQQDKQQQQLGDSEGNGKGQMAGNGQGEQEVDEGAIVQQVNITNGAVGGIDFFA